MKKIYTFLFSFLFPFLLFSQKQQDLCGFNQLYLDMQKDDPSLLENQEKIENDYLEFVYKAAAQQALKSEKVLPVVVHVVHLPGTPIGEEENLPDADIIAGLDRLNDVFAGTPCGSDPIGNDMDIKFELAKQDIKGNPTTGIVRHASTYSELGFGGFSFMIFDVTDYGATFPTSYYINVYLVKEICYAFVNNECVGPLGLATSPSAHGRIADGIAVEAGLWAAADDPCLGAKLTAHEFGHFLNLFHTFENGCPNDNCLTQGDRVCDTPPDDRQDRQDSPCLTGGTVNSCTTDADDDYCNPYAIDEPDAEDNLMDYSPFACQYRFTEGQKNRMHACLYSIRNSMLESLGLNDPCLPVIATQITGTNRTVEDSIEIYLSNAENVDSLSWLVDGIFVSNDVDLSYAFPNFGKRTITLQAFNNVGCMTEKHFTVKVYQTDCNLNVSVSDQINICNGFSNGNAFVRLWASPNGGDWQDEQGVYLTGALNEFYAGGYAPGTHKLFYTVKQGWCQNTVETSFTVSDEFLDVNFWGDEFDCNNPQGGTMQMDISASDFGTWWDNQDNMGSFSNFSTTEDIEIAGTYTFQMFTSQGNECTLSIRPPTQGPDLQSDIEIKTCDDCQNGQPNLCLEGVPPGAEVQWFGGYPNTFMPTNRWEVLVTETNGCEHWSRIEVNSLDNLNPVCSAGSTSGIYCGQSGMLLGAVSQGGELEYWWTTEDGSIIAGRNTLTPTVNRPGTYVFHVRNTLSGCGDSDTTHLFPLTKQAAIADTICFGENMDGYTESGTYIDTLTYACDCDSIRTLELTVLEENFTTVDTTICKGEIFNGLSEPGIYDFIFTGINGCDSILQIELNVNDIEIMIDNQFDDGTGSGRLTITDVSGGDAPFTYLWSNGEITSSIDSLFSDDYLVTVTDARGCEKIFSFFVEMADHVFSLSENIEVNLFPNPVAVGHDFIFEINSQQAEYFNIKIIDKIGRIIHQRQHAHFSKITTERFNLPIAGFYFVLLKNEKGERAVYKLVVD